MLPPKNFSKKEKYEKCLMRNNICPRFCQGDSNARKDINCVTVKVSTNTDGSDKAFPEYGLRATVLYAGDAMVKTDRTFPVRSLRAGVKGQTTKKYTNKISVIYGK